ncbi:MAG TPA: DUF1028 domain-containing protein [Anaerolineae bacterium]|nr:DUF1028 domain-containing protein [Anaerolineae bacterium]
MYPSEYLVSTFSIIAYDPNAQEWGAAVESKAFAVGAMVPWVQASVGAVATQSHVNISFGPRGLALLRRGQDPKAVIQTLISRDKGAAQRQLAVIDAQGRAANYTGDECPAWAGGIAEQNVAVQGNLLAGERVVTAMLAAFHKTPGKLGARLIAALEAGQRAGGDKRGDVSSRTPRIRNNMRDDTSGQQAAALRVAREKSDINGIGDNYIDLRVDDHTAPIAELRRLYEVWEREFYPFLEGNRIKALLRAKKYARAQRTHREFVANAERLARKHSTDADLLNVLAWTLAQNAFGLDAALKYARRAAKLKPKDENIADTLAEVYYQRGDAAQAAEIERALVTKNSERADFQEQLRKFEKAAQAPRRA